MTSAALDKKIFVPYMCDHSHVIAAALEHDGMAVEVLAPPDDASLDLGLQLCRGRECLPCLTLVGDILRRSRQPDFDAARSALLMVTTGGLCRLGQYWKLLQQILEEYGLGELQLLLPSPSNSYSGLGRHPSMIRSLMWDGLVAVDLLTKLLHQYRPYEVSSGEADRAYASSLWQVVEAIKAGGGRRLVSTMERVGALWELISIHPGERRPLIGLVGEIYVRLNDFSNQGIIRKLEAAGAEVELATTMEWIYFTNWLAAGRSRAFGEYGSFVASKLLDGYQKHREHQIAKPIRRLLRRAQEPSTAQLMRNVEPHYEPLLGMEGELALSLGRAVEFALDGVSGIVNVMPFACMPGIVVAGLAPRFRADLGGIPWLDLSYDAQGGTNVQTRLEAFMYQARQYRDQMRSRSAGAHGD